MTPAEVRLAHLAVIVRDLDAAEAVYSRCLGLRPSRRATLPEEGIRVSFIPVGDSAIELLEPIESGGPLAGFLATRGEGIHHLAFLVPDLQLALARAMEAGLRLIDKAPRPGVQGTRVAFLHPITARGVLIEFVEQPPKGLGGER